VPTTVMAVTIEPAMDYEQTWSKIVRDRGIFPSDPLQYFRVLQGHIQHYNRKCILRNPYKMTKKYRWYKLRGVIPSELPLLKQ
jgi:hypothetical protein